MRRVLLGVLLLAVLLVGGVVLGGEALLNTGAVRARVAAAVERATGHPLVIEGPIGLAWSASPAVSIEKAALRNGAGFSRADLATVQRVEARIALLPLLSGRIEIPDVTIRGADVLLEQDAQGRGNWLPAPVPAAPASPGPPPRARTPPSIGRLTIEASRLAWRGAPPVEVERLVASPSGGPVEGRVVLAGVPFAIAGRTGPAGRLPVPVDLTAVGGGLAVAVAGQAGAALRIQVLAPDLAALSAMAGRALPPLRDVAVSIDVDAAGLHAVHLVAGPSTLPRGLLVTRLDASVAAPDAPLRLTAEAALHALPVALSLNLARPDALVRGGATAFQALALADGGSIAVQGMVGDAATPAPGSGAAFDATAFDATVTASLPDLARTGAAAGMSFPAVRDLALTARLLPTPGAGGGRAGVVARGLRLTSVQGDIAGDLAFGIAPRPSVRGTLQSQSLDVDALLEFPTPAPAPVAAAPAPAVPAPAVTPAALVPPRTLPFAALRRGDADLRLAVGQAIIAGHPWRAVQSRVLLQDGKLRIDPLQAEAPGGPLQASLAADAAAAANDSTLALTLRAAGIDAAALAGPELSGALDLDVQLAGRGGDLRSLAASGQGHAGVALIDGEVENQALVALFGSALHAANVPFEAGGRSRLRCFAARVDVAAGIAHVEALAIDATRLRLEGEGTLNLGDDTIDMRLRPTLRIGPTRVAIPVRLTGPLRAPRPALERGAISPGRVGISIGGTAADPCPPALLAARGHTGPQPQAPGGVP